MNIKELLGYALIILGVILLRTFVFTIVRVNQDSMFDTLVEGDLLVLKKFDKSFDRFDIVIVQTEGEAIVKRIVGMPLEDIEYKDEKLYINEVEMEDKYNNSKTEDFKGYCAKDEYFVLGDNRKVSKDSRMFGCVSKKSIVGTVDLRIFPFNKIGMVK